MKPHGNMVSQKENDNIPEAKVKVSEYYVLTDKEFKIALIEKLNVLQKKKKKNQKASSMISGMKLLNRINTLPKKLKLKKYQMEILKLKKSINEEPI